LVSVAIFGDQVIQSIVLKFFLLLYISIFCPSLFSVLEDKTDYKFSSEGEQRQTNSSKRIPFEKWPVNDETRPVNGVASSGVVGSNGVPAPLGAPSEKVATNALKKNKVLLQPIPASHYEESQRQILINKQFFETDGKMK